MISGKKINEDLTVRYGMVRYGKFGVVPIQNDPLFYLSFYIFIQMRIIGIHLLFCIYYYNYTAVQYGWCICISVIVSYLYVCFNPSSISQYPSSSLEFCSIFFLSARRLQSRNLAILSCRDGPFYTVLPPPSIHPCMYVYGSNSSEMRSILTIQD